jgi:hypothetical protein
VLGGGGAGVAADLEKELKIPLFRVVVERCRKLERPRGVNDTGYIDQLMTMRQHLLTDPCKRTKAAELYWPGLPAWCS